MKILKDKSLKKYTTFRIGGKADFFVEAKNTQEIIEAISFAKEKKIPFVVIGNGSNILIDDKGYGGLVIKVKSEKLEVRNNLLVCDAGVHLSKIINESFKQGLTGTEFLAGIPGTLGGAIAGNAGASEKNIGGIAGIIESAALLKGNKFTTVGKEYFNSNYRESKIKKSKDVILEATLRLKRGNIKNIKEKIKKSLEKRKKQPYGYSAGSIFKNPKKYKAGWLIEKAGLKGITRGGAQVSEKHANFIMNFKNANSKDVTYLINKIQKIVMNKFSVQLEREVRYLTERGWR